MTRWRRAAPALAVALGCLGALIVQRARAELGERILALGDELALLAPAAGQVDAETAIELNGQPLIVSTLRVRADVSTVLDRFDAACARSAPQLTAELARAQPAAAKPYLGVLRQVLDDRASAICLAQPEDASLRRLVERASAFRPSADLSALGELRFLSARRGPGDETDVLVARAAGPIRLSAMFPDPRHGDAAGRDIAGVPRPPGARRLLSAFARGQAYGIVAYELSTASELAASRSFERGADAAIGRAFEGYAAALERAGFTALPLELAVEHPLAVFARGDDSLLVQAFASERAGVLSIARLGSHHRVTASTTVQELAP